MITLLYIIISIFLVSVVSLVGIFALFIKNQAQMERILFMMVSFAVGSLLGAAFLDLLPEAFEHLQSGSFIFILSGIMLFFIIEKFLFWYHCHKQNCKVHTFKYMSLIGDSVHNFIDGMIISSAFLTSTALGIGATAAIVMHEIPQELGDFGILCHGGFSKAKALFYNFLTALTSFLGAFTVYFFCRNIEGLSSKLLAFAAGGFIYIACTDLMPELGKEIKIKRSLWQFVLIFLGIVVIWLVKILFD